MYHHMGLGESIGYSARLTQNNSSLYAGNYGMRFIHDALLGDPTLRLRYTSPASELTASVANEKHELLDWKSADPPPMGYKVYRRTTPTEMFTVVSSDIIMDTQYIDSCMVDPGIYEYMVRSINLLVTPSGSYHDLGTGVSDTVLLKSSHAVEAAFEYTLTDNTLRITANTSLNATSYLWDFGDGNFSSEDLPEHVYLLPGHYVVTLFATSECDENMTSQELDILSSVEPLEEGRNFTVYPSPAHDELIVFLGASRKSCDVVLTRIDGTVVWSRRDVPGGQLQVNVQELSRGAYLVQVIDHKGFSSIRRVLLQ
jgi:PKD repeat protein